jgi:non-ribosomal peptide synthetase component F/aryl carrier-like protein
MATRVEAVEPALAGIWADVLGLEQVAPDDDFFALGGTSLLAMQIVARASDAFGVELALDALFAAPTVAGMARELAAGGPQGTTRDGARPARRRGLFGRRTRASAAPALSPLQESAWAVQRYNPAARPHVGEAFRVEGPLDVAALERALTELVARHEILRTAFPLVGHRPQPRVHEPAPVHVPVVTLPRGGRQRAEAELNELVHAARADPFDYEAAPPLRIRLIRRSPSSHVLVLTTHEIACDGAGFDALVRELGLLYDAFAAGRPSPLPQPALQYAEVLREQAQRDDGRGAADAAHWRRALADAPLTIPLPFETGGRPPHRDDAAQARGSVPRAVSERLRALAQAEAATSFMVHLAAFYVLLHRHSGESRLLVTSPAANRVRTELEPVIGFFARVLPLRVALGDEPSFRTLLQRTREATLAAFAHADGLPEDNRLRELTGVRGLGGVGCVFRLWDTTLERRLELEGARVAPWGEGGEGSAVAAIVTEAPDRETHVALSTADLGKATTDALLAQYLRILDVAGAEAEVPIGALELLGEGERRQLADGWNPGRGAAGDDRRLHELVAAQAARTPDAIALRTATVDGWETLTYAQLDARAQALREKPAAEDLLTRAPSAELVVELLAALQAGFAIGGGRDAVGGADALAFVVPTAGTTGSPKRVELTHRALVHAAAWRQHAYRLGPGDRALHLPGPGVSSWALTPWAYLACGATVTIPGRAPEPGPHAVHWLAEQDVTIAGLGPALAASVLGSGDGDRGPLRTLLVQGRGAVALPARTRTRLDVFREYALLEAGGLVLSARVRPGAGAGVWEGLASEQPAALGARAYVLDAQMRPLPPGAAGELWLGGDGIARGYADDAAGTAAAFVPDPFAPADAPGARLVRSGDLARRRLDGTLELLGRAHDDVRFRGFRLEPVSDELEATLAAHPQLAGAAVAWDAARETLVAYVAGRRGAVPEPAELDRWLQERMADWVLPGRYVAVDSVPRRADGAPDRAALAALPGARALGDDDPGRSAPRTRTEKKLQAIWKQVLDAQTVGVHESFFAHGGNLIRGVELIERARAEGISVREEDLMFRPTIAELAALADAAA